MVTWIGTTSSLWSLGTNWVGGVVPATTDPVVFDVTGVARACTIDATGTWSGGTLTVNSAYANTITQNTGINLNIAAYSQTGATMTCSATATFTSTTFSVTGGTFTQGGAFVSTTFGVTSTGIYTGSSATMSTTAVTHSNTATITATSGVWSLAGSWTKNNSPTFTHNSGTINITAASTFSPAATLNLVTINTNAANVTIAAGTTVPLGSNPSTSLTTGTLSSAGVITFSGNWTHAGVLTITGTLTGTSTPTLSVDRNLTTTGATITNAIGTVTITGSAAGTSYTDTSDALSGSTFVLSKTNQNVTVAASTNMRCGSNSTQSLGTGTLTITGTLTWSGSFGLTGTLTATGTLTGTSTPTIAINQSLTTSSATITNAIGTITFNGTTASTYTDTGDKLASTTFVITKTGIANVTVAASTIMRLGASPTSTMLASTSTLTVTGTVNVSGTWTLTGGALTVGATGTVSGALTALTITKNFTVTAGGVFPASVVVTLASTSGSQSVDAAGITFATSFISQGSGGAATIANGTTFPIGASPTTATGTGILTVNGILSVSGTWTHTGSLTIGAAGTVSGALTNLTIDRSLTITAGGVFPASVAVAFNGSATPLTHDANGIVFGTCTINSTLTNNITIAAGTTIPLGLNPSTSNYVSGSAGTITVNGAITCSGTWTHNGKLSFSATGSLSGGLTAMSVNRDLTVNSAATWPSGLDITVHLVDGTQRTFSGGGKTYGAFRNIGTAGIVLVIADSNTFTSFRDNDGTVAHTIQFTAGTTQTATTFAFPQSGSGAQILTINTTVAASAATVHTTGGDVYMDFMSIQDITADASPLWEAGVNSTNVSGNTNINFDTPSSGSAAAIILARRRGRR